MSPEKPTPRPRGLGTRAIHVGAVFLKACYTHGSQVAVRNDQDELLFVRQNLRERGRWGFPGGFLTVGEDPRDGAVRELREETGIDCGPLELKTIDEYKQPWARHYEHLFGLSVQGDGTHAVKSIEIQTRGWFAIDDLPNKLTSPANEALVRMEQKGWLSPDHG